MTSIIEQAVMLVRLHPKTITQVADEACVNRDFATNWGNYGQGARITNVEKVLRAIGYQLTITRIKPGDKS